MSIWFVPRDAAARSMGADAVASALEARGEGGGGRRRKGAGGRRCFNCGQVGHLSADCDLPPGNTACYNCGQQGHKSSECPN